MTATISTRLDAVNPCTGAGLAISPGASAARGSSLVVTGSATCPKGETPEFQFFAQPPGGQWTSVKAYGDANTYTFATTGSTPTGPWGFQVYIRAHGNVDGSEAISAPETVTVTASANSVLDSGADATFVAEAGISIGDARAANQDASSPPAGPLSGVLVTSRPDWLFYVRDNGAPPWSGPPLVAAAASYDLGATQLTGVGRQSVQNVAEWDYSGTRIPNGSTDGSGLPRSTFPCFDALQGCTPPVSDADAIGRMKAYYEARVADLPAHGKVISTTGHFFFQHYGAEWGADLIESEVGENINSTQAHIAFCRGASRQYGKPWGLDMSSWYRPGNRDWTKPGIWGASSCPTCGHSLSLTERTYFAAYMAGASFLEDEGGSFNFFLGNTQLFSSHLWGR